jgi:Methyltransferase domain
LRSFAPILAVTVQAIPRGQTLKNACYRPWIQWQCSQRRYRGCCCAVLSSERRAGLSRGFVVFGNFGDRATYFANQGLRRKVISRLNYEKSVASFLFLLFCVKAVFCIWVSCLRSPGKSSFRAIIKTPKLQASRPGCPWPAMTGNLSVLRSICARPSRLAAVAISVALTVFLVLQHRPAKGPTTLPSPSLAALRRDKYRISSLERKSLGNTPLCNTNPYLPNFARAEQEWGLSFLLRFKTKVSSFSQLHRDSSGWAMFDIVDDVMDCPGISRYGGTLGDSDGGKWLCGIQKLSPGCNIYSLGSNGDFTFEESMLVSTPCTIHTFDCTLSSAPNVPSGRIKFYSTCVGASDSGDDRFKTLPTIMKELGHSSVDLLKIDIEGYEHDILRSFAEYKKKSPAGPFLPNQLSIEIHQYAGGVGPIGLPQLMESFQSLVDAGYVPISREDNFKSNDCSEFTWIRLGC